LTIGGTQTRLFSGSNTGIDYDATNGNHTFSGDVVFNDAVTATTFTGQATSALIRSQTAQTSTGVTAINFTGIPSGVKRITVLLSGVSTNGSDTLLIQIGSSAFTTSGYSSYQSSIDGSSTNSFSLVTTGFVAKITLSAAITYTGTMVLNLLTGDTWMATGSTAASNGLTTISNGFLALGGTLDRVRVIASTTGSPGDTFDAGTMNILYE